MRGKTWEIVFQNTRRNHAAPLLRLSESTPDGLRW
jgi:hypothetical protein